MLCRNGVYFSFSFSQGRHFVLFKRKHRIAYVSETTDRSKKDAKSDRVYSGGMFGEATGPVDNVPRDAPLGGYNKCAEQGVPSQCSRCSSAVRSAVCAAENLVTSNCLKSFTKSPQHQSHNFDDEFPILKTNAGFALKGVWNVVSPCKESGTANRECGVYHGKSQSRIYSRPQLLIPSTGWWRPNVSWSWSSRASRQYCTSARNAWHA
jgi:hypothetical protein